MSGPVFAADYGIGNTVDDNVDVVRVAVEDGCPGCGETRVAALVLSLTDSTQVQCSTCSQVFLLVALASTAMCEHCEATLSINLCQSCRAEVCAPCSSSSELCSVCASTTVANAF